MIKKRLEKIIKKIKKRKRNPRYNCHALMLWHDLGLSYLSILSCILKHKPRSQRYVSGNMEGCAVHHSQINY